MMRKRRRLRLTEAAAGKRGVQFDGHGWLGKVAVVDVDDGVYPAVDV
jgi:hypothetical protein